MTHDLPLFDEIAVCGCRVEALQQLSGDTDLIVLKFLKLCRYPAWNETQDVSIPIIATKKPRSSIETGLREMYEKSRREVGGRLYGAPYGIAYTNDACRQSPT